MPDNPDPSAERPTQTRRPVILRVDYMGEAPSADALLPAGADPVRIHARPAPEAGTRPNRPFERPRLPGLRPDDGGPTKRVFTSGQSSQTQGAEPEEGELVVELPRTRYRFGAALPDGRSPGPPPNPSLAGANPVRAAAGVLRGIAMATRTVASQYANRSSGHGATATPPISKSSPGTTREED
jgi:hypothetical protein